MGKNGSVYKSYLLTFIFPSWLGGWPCLAKVAIWVTQLWPFVTQAWPLSLPAITCPSGRISIHMNQNQYCRASYVFESQYRFYIFTAISYF